ncbi:MAG: YdeI/OmpD-associated family protein [Pseudomonadota bacterium]
MKEVEITSKDQLWRWLEKNNAQTESVRLITWKAMHAEKYVSREDVLDGLVAHGWIDGRRFKVDENRTAQLISPRKQQAWSKSYKERAARLSREGVMHPSGTASVQDGHSSGLWNFFDDVDALIVPEDLKAVVDLKKWESQAPSYRRNLLRWLKLAKTATTRKNRIATICKAIKTGVKIPQM